MQNDSAWFVDWFNSPYYHILYKDRDEKEAETFIDKLLDFLKPAPGSKVLDLACGKGRHSLFLNKKGLDVTGVDLSTESIAHASQYENETLTFFVHDMRRVLRVNDFDYVFNLFTSFGYFEKEKDNQDVVLAAATALRKTGTLVIDFMNIEKILHCLKGEEIKTVDEIEFHIRRFTKDKFLVKEIRFTDKGKDYHFREKVKMVSLEDFKSYFEKAGLTIKHLFGDYHLNIFDPLNSDRLILVGEFKN